MTMLAFDTHSHIKRLIAAGFTEAQAEAQTQALLELLENRLVTKDDIRDMATRADLKALATKDDIRDMATRQDLAEMRQEMATKDDIRDMATKDDIRDMATRQDLAEIRQEMATKDDIRDMATQKDLELLSKMLTIKLGGVVATGIFLLGALQVLL
ncbi:MAG: hypothetical protein ACLFSK_07985 [Ectothiorhodospira sp.]